MHKYSTIPLKLKTSVLANLRTSSSASMGKIVRAVRAKKIIVNPRMKIVLKLSMENKKKREKSMICAAGVGGVESVSVSTKEQKMIVEGEGIDFVALMCLLRKKMGHAELVMVMDVKEKEETKVMKVEENVKSPTLPLVSSCYDGQSMGVMTRPPYGQEPDSPYYFCHPVEAIVAQSRSDYYDNTQDKLLLWRLNHTQKDGSLSSQEAKQKWKLACQILAEKGLIPEDENIVENERVFKAVMETEHPKSIMLYKDFGITLKEKFSNNAPSFGAESSKNKAELERLAEEMSEQSKEILSLKNTVNQLVALMQQQCQVSQALLPSTSDAGKKNVGASEDEIIEEL